MLLGSLGSGVISCYIINGGKILKSIFNPYLHYGLFHPYYLEESISSFGAVWCILYIFNLFRIANNVDPERRLIWVCIVCQGPNSF